MSTCTTPSSRWNPARNCLCREPLCTVGHPSQPGKQTSPYLSMVDHWSHLDLPESGGEASVPAGQKICFCRTPSKCSHTSSKVFHLLPPCVQLKPMQCVSGRYCQQKCKLPGPLIGIHFVHSVSRLQRRMLRSLLN